MKEKRKGKGKQRKEVGRRGREDQPGGLLPKAKFCVDLFSVLFFQVGQFFKSWVQR